MMTASPKVGTTSGVSQAASGGANVTTPAQTVASGAAIYVQVAIFGSPGGTPAVTDSIGGTYSLLASGSSHSVNLFVFRRAGPIGSSSTSFKVTVQTFNLATEAMAIEILNDGGVDVVGTVQTGNGITESAVVLTTENLDEVLFLGADASGTFSSWGSGQTGISGYPTPPTSITAWGSYQSQLTPGTASSSRTLSVATSDYVAVSVSITPSEPWSAVAGRPFVTVSPIGLTSSPAAPIANNGADFGPDTPGTSTIGIQEAIDSLGSNGGTVYLLPGTFAVSSQINLAPNVTLEGATHWTKTAVYATIKPPAGSFSGSTVIGTNPSSNVLQSGFGLAHIIVDCSNLTSPPDGIHFDNCDHSSMFDVQVQGAANGIVFGWVGTGAPTGQTAPGQIMIDRLKVGGWEQKTGGVGILFKYQTQVLGSQLQAIQGAGGSGSTQTAMEFYSCSKIAIFGFQANTYTQYGIRFTDDGSVACTECVVEGVSFDGGGVQDVYSDGTKTSGTLPITGKNRVANGAAVNLAFGYTSPTLVQFKVSNLRGASDLGFLNPPPQPTGTGSAGANLVANSNPFSVVVYYGYSGPTGQGAHVLDQRGTDRKLPSDTGSVVLAPGDSIWFETNPPLNTWRWKTLE